MAVVFELVVNFGTEADAARRAVDRIAAAPPIATGGPLVGLHPPISQDTVSFAGAPYLEVAVCPIGVSYGLPLDTGHPLVELSSTELSALGRGLYELLAHLDGYQAAKVGWDCESFADLDELRHDWPDELAGGNLPGLVLSSGALASLAPTSGFERFAPGFGWIPYAGETWGARG